MFSSVVWFVEFSLMGNLPSPKEAVTDSPKTSAVCLVEFFCATVP